MLSSILAWAIYARFLSLLIKICVHDRLDSPSGLAVVPLSFQMTLQPSPQYVSRSGLPDNAYLSNGL